MAERKAGKTRRDAGRAAGRPDAGKTKRSFSLPPETSRRLDVYAACSGREPAALVAELIDTHFRRYVITDRGGATPSPEESEAA